MNCAPLSLTVRCGQASQVASGSRCARRDAPARDAGGEGVWAKPQAPAGWGWPHTRQGRDARGPTGAGAGVPGLQGSSHRASYPT